MNMCGSVTSIMNMCDSVTSIMNMCGQCDFHHV